MLTVQAWDMAGKLADPRTLHIAGTSLNVALMSLGMRGLKAIPMESARAVFATMKQTASKDTGGCICPGNSEFNTGFDSSEQARSSVG